MAISIKDLDLRQAIIAKLSGATQESLRETIADAIQSKEEKTLPGLGVLFEILWQ
ncbi:MAG: small acid-soluble spore protein SspI, partial [Thermicanus sp.]|nr:small acid-soluble spore protein SspI [Thermicanus sp.]